jgi:hypothetical protein
VHGLGDDEAEPADGLDAHGDTHQRGLPIEALGFGGRQHRGHDHRTGMHRPAFEGVIEVLAVRRGTIDEGRTRRAHAGGVADAGGGAGLRPRGERRSDVGAVARGNAQADDIDEHALCDLAHGRRHAGAIEAGDALGQPLGDGGLLIVHVTPVARSQELS